MINPYVLDGIIWLSQHLAFSFFIGMFFGVFIVDVCYSLQLANKFRKFADENDIVIRYEELKIHMAQRREAKKEKARFMLAFRTEETIRSHLERYRDVLENSNDRYK